MLYRKSHNQYGVPLEQAHDEDTEGWWKVAMNVDYAAAAMQKKVKELGDKAPMGAQPTVKLDPKYTPSKRSQTPHE